MCEHCSRLGSGFREAPGEWETAGLVETYGPRHWDDDYLSDGSKKDSRTATDTPTKEGVAMITRTMQALSWRRRCGRPCMRTMNACPAQYVQDALLSVFGEVTPAESESLGSALDQIGRAAAQAATDPACRSDRSSWPSRRRAAAGDCVRTAWGWHRHRRGTWKRGGEVPADSTLRYRQGSA